MEKGADITFAMAAWMVLKRVLTVLVIPLGLALCSRKFLPNFVAWLKTKRNIAFYLWSFNLSIIMGLAMQNIMNAPVSGWVLVTLCIIPLLLAIFQFSMGKLVGYRYGDSIGAGQALGQKNTVFAIWAGYTFFDPVSSIAGGFYSIFHNVWNSYQLSQVGKHPKN